MNRHVRSFAPVTDTDFSQHNEGGRRTDAGARKLKMGWGLTDDGREEEEEALRFRSQTIGGISPSPSLPPSFTSHHRSTQLSRGSIALAVPTRSFLSLSWRDDRDLWSRLFGNRPELPGLGSRRRQRQQQRRHRFGFLLGIVASWHAARGDPITAAGGRERGQGAEEEGG